VRFFGEYKTRAGARTLAVVDEYISAGQKAYEREEKLLKRKQKKDAEKAAQPQPPAPPPEGSPLR
jgi:hypothetical protein